MDGTGWIIIGAYGQLGKALAEKLPKARATDRDTLDITDPRALDAFDWTGIKVLVNAAGYTNVDGAEAADGRIAAWQINATAVANLARIAHRIGATLIHVSTDYVFDGTHTPHTEDEPLSPLGVYAQAKAAGDVAVSVVPQHYILRVSWLIGDGANFVRTMMGLAHKNISPAVVSDQIGRLTFTPTLVDAILHLVSRKAEFGTYNLTNDGESVSWADITRAIFTDMGRDDLTVKDITTAEYFANKPEAAPRPLLSTLDLTKLKHTGFTPTDWRVELTSYVRSNERDN